MSASDIAIGWRRQYENDTNKLTTLETLTVNKTTLRSCHLSLALCLGAACGLAIAKGPGTQALGDQATMRYQCTSSYQGIGSTAKSPQGALSPSCVPAGSPTVTLRPGDTAAKAPSRFAEPER